jgi:hypothetical protein
MSKGKSLQGNWQSVAKQEMKLMVAGALVALVGTLSALAFTAFELALGAYISAGVAVVGGAMCIVGACMPKSKKAIKPNQ